MKYLPNILLLWLCIWAAWAGAQTPYDSFAPEMSRPILDKDSVDAWRKEQQMQREQEQLQREQETLARLQQEPLFVAFDMQQQMCYLLDTAMQVLAYTPIPEDVQRWLSVDPLVDKNISTSPYLYCNGNPVMFIDPDGRDDEFNNNGGFIRHVDNGTDFVMIQTEDGSFRNVTEFDYSSDCEENLKMLSNVGSYYMRKAGMTGYCGVKENTSREGAFASTGSISRKLSFIVNNGKLRPMANTASNILNAFVHEKIHVNGNMDEITAILSQISHSSWNSTTTEFQDGIIGYASEQLNASGMQQIPPELQPYIYFNEIHNVFESILKIKEIIVIGKKQ